MWGSKYLIMCPLLNRYYTYYASLLLSSFKKARVNADMRLVPYETCRKQISAKLRTADILIFLQCAHFISNRVFPLLNCLRLERVLKGVNRVQGVNTIDRLPITVTICGRFTAILIWRCWTTPCFGRPVV